MHRVGSHMALEYAIPPYFVYPGNSKSATLLNGIVLLWRSNCVMLKGLRKSDEQKIRIIIARRALMREWIETSQGGNSDLIPGLVTTPLSL